MLEWLSKIDPNTLAALAVLVLTFLYHLARRDAKGTLLAQLEDLGKQVVHVLVTDPQITSDTSLDALKSLAKAEFVALAKKAGIPDNAITEALISQFTDQAVAAALAEMRTIDAGTPAPAVPVEAAPLPTATITPKSARRYRVSKAASAAVLAMLICTLIPIQGCNNPQVKTWTGTFAGCEEADLGQMVTVEGVTTGLLTAIGFIVQGNFPALENDLTQLATTVGFGAVRCAILAFEAAITQPTSAAPQVVPPGLVRMKAWLGKQEAAAAAKGSTP